MPVRRLFHEQGGGVAPLAALAAIPLIAGVGAAVDYSRANGARTAMQSALDATALMLSKQAAQLSSDQISQDASTYFTANFARQDVQAVQVTAANSSQAGGGAVSMTASGSLQALFMGLIGIPTIGISVKSGAVLSADGLGCVLSLNKSASGAATAQGST